MQIRSVLAYNGLDPAPEQTRVAFEGKESGPLDGECSCPVDPGRRFGLHQDIKTRRQAQPQASRQKSQIAITALNLSHAVSALLLPILPMPLMLSGTMGCGATGDSHVHVAYGRLLLGRVAIVAEDLRSCWIADPFSRKLELWLRLGYAHAVAWLSVLFESPST